MINIFYLCNFCIHLALTGCGCWILYRVVTIYFRRASIIFVAMGCKLLRHLTFARRDWIKTKVSVHLHSPVRHVLCYRWYIILGVSIKRKDHFSNGIQRMRSEQWTLTEGMGKEKGLPVPQICWTSCTDTADSCISTGAFLTLQPSNRCTRCTYWCHGFAFSAGFGGGERS